MSCPAGVCQRVTTSPLAVAPTQRVKVAPSVGVTRGCAPVSAPLAVAVMMVPLPRVDAQMPLPLEAVSYTHLDVYKRQPTRRGA